MYLAYFSVFQFSSELLSSLQQITHKSFHPGNYYLSAVTIKAQQFSTILASITFKDFFRVSPRRTESIHMNVDGPRVCSCHLYVKQKQMILSVCGKFLMCIRHKTPNLFLPSNPDYWLLQMTSSIAAVSVNMILQPVQW